MAHPLVIYIPGLLPKPEPEKHREALLRCVLAGLRRMNVSIFLLLALLLTVEFAAAQLWLPALAWPLHLIAVTLGLAVALAAHLFGKVFNVDALIYSQTACRTVIEGDPEYRSGASD